MSTLFAMSQVALFGRGLRNNPSSAPATECDSQSSLSAAPIASAVEWATPDPSASGGQPARWRINSTELEEMMMRAAVGLGFDRTHRPSATTIDEHHDQQHQRQSPLSQPAMKEESPSPKKHPLSGLLPSSRGASPVFHKAVARKDYLIDQTLDTTAPSSPCTPSMTLRNLSTVSPTSNDSYEMTFQHQISSPSGRHPADVGAIMPRAQQHVGQQSGNNNLGRFGLKLLVSNSMAGTLIGKGGTRICEIKDECLADIKVTPNGRFYPGTHERVVLVVGESSAVQLACDRIVTTIYTAADTSLDITQRVLIPDAASVLIIGHDGGRLGDLRQEAGVASIQVSPRDMCTVAGERVVTLQGPMSAVIHGLSLIVNRMMENTTASRYQNMSTIYRAVHLPPYAVPSRSNMHGGSSHHSRRSPSYGDSHPHSHDFHSPRTGTGPPGTGREYSNNGPNSNWVLSYSGGMSREFTGHPGGSNGGTPVEFVQQQQHHETGSPVHPHPHHVGAHFGGRYSRHQSSPTSFDTIEGGNRDYVSGRGSVGPGSDPLVDDLRRKMAMARGLDSPSSCRGGKYAPRDGHIRHNSTPTRRSTFNPSYPCDPHVDSSAFHSLQQQQLLSASAEFSSQDGSAVTGVLPHEARAASAVASVHRSRHEGRTSPIMIASSHADMESPGGDLCSVAVPGAGRMHGITRGSDAGLVTMFEGMKLTSPNRVAGPSQPASCSRQVHQNGTSDEDMIVHGELPIPDADVGIILGKGGATVRELQQLSGAKIMIARRNEFVPGTKQRLVTLAGSVMSVNMARFLIMRKIHTERGKL